MYKGIKRNFDVKEKKKKQKRITKKKKKFYIFHLKKFKNFKI